MSKKSVRDVAKALLESKEAKEKESPEKPKDKDPTFDETQNTAIEVDHLLIENAIKTMSTKLTENSNTINKNLDEIEIKVSTMEKALNELLDMLETHEKGLTAIK